jgi:gliding motility-associated-like protein
MKLFYKLTLALLFWGAASSLKAQCGACFEQVQLIQNGNFSSGNTGFTTELNLGTGFFCPLCPEGTYAVGTNAIFYHNDFTGNDHTNPPSGSFFIANGIGQGGMEVWCQIVNVQPNTDYTFSFWARDVTNNPNPHPLAQLQPTFNGVPLGELLVAQGGWQQGQLNWNSGSLTQVTICLLNMETGTGGNDFGIDDISLVGCHEITLSHQAEAGADTQICGGTSLSIGMPNYSGYQYSWTTSSGLTSTNTSNPNYSLQNLTPNLITEELFLSLDSAGVGCISIDSITISVLPQPSISLGSDLTICPGESAVLTATGSWDALTWSTNETTPTITVQNSGTYSATADLNGCTLIDSQIVNFVSMPAVDLGPDQAICEGDDVLLVTGVMGTWSTGVNGNSITATAEGDYWFLYSNQGCEVSDTMYLDVFTTPVVTLQDEYSFCENSSVILSINESGNWSTGLTSTSIEVTEPGIYSVIVENGPCQAIDGTIVSEIPIPVINLEDEFFACEFTTFPIEVEEIQGVDYLWSNEDTTASTLYTVPAEGGVTASNVCGSDTEEFILYGELCSWGLWIPSSFTPNGDGDNDVWFVDGYNISNLEILVYNKFGDRIWRGTNLLESWDPQYQIIPDDCYSYRVEAIDYNGNEIVKYGYITLLK